MSQNKNGAAALGFASGKTQPILTESALKTTIRGPPKRLISTLFWWLSPLSMASN